MTKEIVKLRAYFQTKNLQKQSMLKAADRIKQNKCLHKKITDKSNITNIEDNNFIEDEIAVYIGDVTDDQINLVIENDSDFKLINKKYDIMSKDNIKNKRYNNNVVCYDKNIKQNIDDNESSKIVTDRTIPIYEEVTILDENAACTNSLPVFNEHKQDLQSLLIMMAINSPMDERTESDDPKYNEYTTTVCGSDDLSKDKEKENSVKCDLTTLLKVQPIIKEINIRQKYIINKYVNIWKLFVNTKRENRMFQQRQETLNNFFDKLSKRKNKTNSNFEPVQKANMHARDYNTYRHRYKLQKHIIALQKAKLEEQNKLIEQFKYNKIVEASRQSLDTMRDDIRKTYYEIDKHLKPKIKCLTNELQLKELEEPSLVLHCLKVPQFLQRMEARAREREEKHAIIRERRKQMEEERIRLKQQAELAKAEMDKEEKLKRIKELRDKRKREKIENIRKKQHADRMRALTVMADLHYEKNLMYKFGIRPLKLLLVIKKDTMEKAKAHHKFQLMKNIFLNWMWYTEDMWFERNYKAEDFNRKKLLTKCFINLKKNHYEFVLKKQVAEDYYDLYVTQLVFRKFREGVEILQKELEIKSTKARLYYNSNILFKTFTCWRSLPALNALKREQDARKLKWRQKVLLVVPDYKPPED